MQTSVSADLSDKSISLIYGRGIKRMPEYVQKALSSEQKKLLAQKGHGLSFPCTSGCQMRIVKDGKDFGGFYSYRQFGSISKAVQAAINRHQQIRLAHDAKPGAKSKTDFTYLVVRFDTRKQKTEWRYQVNYRKNGKVANKAFSLGHTQPSPAKLVHAFLTARLFRFYYDELGENFDQSCFKRWKHTRLYLPCEVAFDWDNA